MRICFSLATILLMAGTALADVAPMPSPSRLSRLSTPFCGSTLVSGIAMALAVAGGGLFLVRRRTSRKPRSDSKS